MLDKRGVGQATIAQHLGLAYLSRGQLADARRCLTGYSDALRRPSPALTHAAASMAQASGRSDRLPVWRSLPRGFIVDSRYQLDAEIGRGGMASVYKAVGIDLVNRGQTVAVKVPSPDLMADEQTRQRFVQEIAVSQRLSASHHAGIVQMLSYVIFDEPHTQRKLYGLVLEYIDGLSLDKFLALRQEKQEPLTAQEIVTILKPICQALDFAHSQVPPVLHRDLKPHNVMLGHSGAKLMDFGIARVLEEGRDTLTGEGQVLGTPVYMPPEFHDPRGEIDQRSDVYLAGNLLLELMTFHPMGNAEGRPDCPATWVDLINDSMSRVRGRRPSTMREFLARLEGTDPTKQITNTIGMQLTLIPAGKFLMGSPKTEEGRSENEGPQHAVTISQPFYMGVYQVTQRDYERLMDKNPAHFTTGRGGGHDHPVEQVSWEDAVEFCRKLSELPEEKRLGRVYRLPTEAEWEYACRAGTSTPFHSGSALSSVQANFNGREPYGGAPSGSYLQSTAPVGSYPPNPFGLYDMHGNVWEWCADVFDRTYYRISPDNDPRGPADGEFRVVRGGSWVHGATRCRAAARIGVPAKNTASDFGFRVVCTISTEAGQRPVTAESGFRFVE